MQLLMRSNDGQAGPALGPEEGLLVTEDGRLSLLSQGMRLVGMGPAGQDRTGLQRLPGLVGGAGLVRVDEAEQRSQQQAQQQQQLEQLLREGLVADVPASLAMAHSLASVPQGMLVGRLAQALAGAGAGAGGSGGAAGCEVALMLQDDGSLTLSKAQPQPQPQSPLGAAVRGAVRLQLLPLGPEALSLIHI